MIDYHQEIITALSTILPVHYEMILHSGLATPCISYMEVNNYQISYGDSSAMLGYSRITYQIKVWADDIALIQQYSLQVDDKMRELGFQRISSGEIYDNESSMIQKIIKFECLARENY